MTTTEQPEVQTFSTHVNRQLGTYRMAFLRDDLGGILVAEIECTGRYYDNRHYYGPEEYHAETFTDYESAYSAALKWSESL